jgi:isopentenyl diphosphate isomerase/L-lactate dehydrogenase-like FMN-dependent dehydrogenase
MNVERAVNIADLRLQAKRQLPRVIFELIDSASEDELVMAKNIERLKAHTLMARVLQGVPRREQATTLFGRPYSTFFGISPMGMIGIVRKDIELNLAEAANLAGIPMILSGASAHALEKVVPKAPGTIWSQLYAAADPKITEDLVRRAEAAGATGLVWTVDLPVYSKNDRTIRNGIGIPAKLSLGAKLESLLHPNWIRQYLTGEMAKMGHWECYVPPGSSSADVLKFYLSQKNSMQTWSEMEILRRLWNGPLIVKGIMNGEDALRAAELGADGIIVSNHGGYGLDRAPASIDMLPGIVAAVGQRLVVMFDGGIRRGSDAIIARCLGAQFVFIGRAALYGAAAGGVAGASRAIAVLKDEIDRTMGLIGCAHAASLGAYAVRRPVDPWSSAGGPAGMPEAIRVSRAACQEQHPIDSDRSEPAPDHPTVGAGT